MTTTQIVILVVVALAILYHKGYIGKSTKTQSGSASDSLGKQFLQAIQAEAQAEAQNEVAANLAFKMKEDAKRKLQVPFDASEPASTKPEVK